MKHDPALSPPAIGHRSAESSRHAALFALLREEIPGKSAVAPRRARAERRLTEAAAMAFLARAQASFAHAPRAAGGRS